MSATDLTRAVPQGQDTLTDERVEELHAAARAGNPDAAREYGRLRLLVPTEELEPWLRKASTRRPKDLTAANLLAGSLVGEIDYMVSDFDYEPGNPPDAIATGRAAAEDLYARVLAADPGNSTATAGLAALRELLDRDGTQRLPEQTGHSWYVVDRETASGSVVCLERLVVAEPAELRWACDRWAGIHEEWWGEAYLTLRTVQAGAEVDRIDLTAHVHEGLTDWSTVTIPPLTGDPLPPGHPVRIADRIAHYGYLQYLT
ncbi:MAG: hypothetical protein WCA46_00835 [Actinocatenispora sp.]